MKILIDGIEPQFKIYKMSENIENKFYIGKTKQPLKERMNGHRHGGHDCVSADNHFSDVGWNNVTVEIIDFANDDLDLALKEQENIIKFTKENGDKILNKYFTKNISKSKHIKDPVYGPNLPVFIRCW